MRTVITEKDQYDVTMLDVNKLNFNTLEERLKPLLESDDNQAYIVTHHDGTRGITIEFFGLRICFFEADPMSNEDILFVMRKGVEENEEEEYAS
jgi:hypothetical protein